MLMGLKAVTCANAVNNARWQMEVASRHGKWIETEQWNCLDKVWRNAVRDFQIAVRVELGLSPEVPEVSDLPQKRFRQQTQFQPDRGSVAGYLQLLRRLDAS